MNTNNSSKSEKDSESENDLLFHKLNQETGKINWSELQRHFARGVLIVVEKDIDLVSIAEQISKNQESIVKSYIEDGKLRHATDDDAFRWNDESQMFWAIVIAPWVLVQECV